MPPTCPVDQLLAKFEITPDFLVESIEHAKACEGKLSDASDALNRMYYLSTAKELYDESQRIHLSPAQEAKRAKALDDVHCLTAHALAWRLSEFFNQRPDIEGFLYELQRDRERANGYRADLVEIRQDGAWRAGADPAHARAIEAFCDSLPALSVIQGSQARLGAPDDQGPAALVALMSDMRAGSVGLSEEAFARWEAKHLDQTARAPGLRARIPGL